MLHIPFIRIAILAAIVLTAGCASYAGYTLRPGKDDIAAVLDVMGKPAMRWQEADGSLQLSYPKGPSGPESYMVRIDKDGKLVSIRNVMTTETFALIRPGMRKEDVLKLLGPPVAAWTQHSPARNELALSWRYEVSTLPAFFTVWFDASAETVRNSAVMREELPLP